MVDIWKGNFAEQLLKEYGLSTTDKDTTEAKKRIKLKEILNTGSFRVDGNNKAFLNLILEEIRKKPSEIAENSILIGKDLNIYYPGEIPGSEVKEILIAYKNTRYDFSGARAQEIALEIEKLTTKTAEIKTIDELLS